MTSQPGAAIAAPGYFEKWKESLKKRIAVHGSLAFPLAIGCAAFIMQTVGGMIRTSPVKHFITLPSGVTYIQTQNTRYYLHPPAKAAAAKGVQI